MSDVFSYLPPDSSTYMKTILLLLRKGENQGLLKQLQSARCEIEMSGTFSGIRWNAFFTTINFLVSIDDFTNINLTQDEKKYLIKICDRAMPRKCGLDVMEVDIVPDIENLENQVVDISEDLRKISELPIGQNSVLFPSDIREKGRIMSEVYYTLYLIENSLRLFIDKVCIENFGENYFSSLKIPFDIQKNISGRKKKEKKNLWMSLRGDSELFYFDFIELSGLIVNNWEIFKDYFPDQAWIQSKLNELYEIRNLIAHNSYIGDHEKKVMEINYKSITLQISKGI